MKELFFSVLLMIIFILLSIVICYIFDKYNVRRNYFRVVAKNKYIYYLSKFILEIVFVTLAIYSFIINKLYLYVITIICMFLYLGLYEGRRIGDFKDVKKIYIDRDSKKKK